MNRSQERLQTLMRDHAGPLTLYARQFFVRGQYHFAEEVVQDVFFRLSRLENWPENLPGWLFASVRNGSISKARSEKRRTRRENEYDAPPFFQTDAELDSEKIAIALESLDREPREILTLHLWGDRSFAEIAELLDTSKSTVFRRYEEALELLRQTFAGEE